MFKWPINQLERIVLFVSALLLIVPGTVTDLIGLVVLVFIFLLKYLEEKRKTAKAA